MHESQDYMDIIYIIQAHKEPLQLKRLIDRLTFKNTYFYIHIDQKSDIHHFTSIINTSENILFISNRINCIWGDFSQVVASLHLIEEVLKHHHNDGFCILISGQDYPLVSTEKINHFFQKNKNDNFIDCSPINQLWNEELCIQRSQHYLYNFSDQKEDFKIFKPGLTALFYLLIGKIPLDFYKKLSQPRKITINLYGGSSWWAFNLSTLRKIQNFIDNNKTMLFEYFKYYSCCDEVFFHSIIKHLSDNDPSIHIKPSITYVNWTRKNCVPAPLPLISMIWQSCQNKLKVNY